MKTFTVKLDFDGDACVCFVQKMLTRGPEYIYLVNFSNSRLIHLLRAKKIGICYNHVRRQVSIVGNLPSSKDDRELRYLVWRAIAMQEALVTGAV